MVERLPYTQYVGGSSPSGSTKFMEAWLSGRRQLLAKESAPLKGSVGSNPTASSNFLSKGNIMKPDSKYRMRSSTKASLAMSPLKDPHQQAAWKRAMIDAELCSAIQPKRENRQSGPQGK